MFLVEGFASAPYYIIVVQLWVNNCTRHVTVLLVLSRYCWLLFVCAPRLLHSLNFGIFITERTPFD